MPLIPFARLVVLTGLVFVSTIGAAHTAYQGRVPRENLARISFLGVLPGADTNVLLVRGAEAGLREALSLSRPPGPQL